MSPRYPSALFYGALACVSVVILPAAALAQLTTTLEWSFTTDQVISIPVVADVDGDGLTEVVLNLTQTDGGSWPSGNIVVLDGQSGIEALRIPHDPLNDQFGSQGRSTVAVGDVSGDGVPDIIYASRPVSGSQSLIVAVDGTGSLLWTSHVSGGADYLFTVINGAISVANFDDDDRAEIVVGASLIDDDGLVVWDQGGVGATFGSNQGYIGGISAIADLSGDGSPEIISGRDAWVVDWQPGPSVTVSSLWSYSGNDGYPAIADLDGNGSPEVVLVASGELIVLDGQTGLLWCGRDPTDAACMGNPANRTQPATLPGGGAGNRGGPAVIADFDSDGRPEVGVAGGQTYTLFDFNRSGEIVVQPPGDPVPGLGAAFVKWTRTISDPSSSSGGSSAFDFDGDGIAEALFADECFFRVYAGDDGSVELEIENTSSTIHEYPITADVDDDGETEVLVVANPIGTCPHADRSGVYAYASPSDDWEPTAAVWTQHGYHVTNALPSGHVPASETSHWTLPGLNAYRASARMPALQVPGLSGPWPSALALILTIGALRRMRRRG